MILNSKKTINANDDYILILLICNYMVIYSIMLLLTYSVRQRKRSLNNNWLNFNSARFELGGLTKQLNLSVCQFLHL